MNTVHYSETKALSNKQIKKLGRALGSLLHVAADEGRITCGLLPAIKMLEMDPKQVLLCIMPHTQQWDAAKHIHSVLLQAFCYEHDITIIKVDSVDKLRDIVKQRDDCSCVLIHRSIDQILCLELELARILQPSISTISPQPVFKLPAK